MDRGAWQAIVHGVAKSWTWMSNWATEHTCVLAHTHTHTHTHCIIICEYPCIDVPYQELGIITLVLQMEKLRHQNLSYIRKIIWGYCVAENAAQLLQHGKHLLGCPRHRQLLKDSADNENYTYQVAFCCCCCWATKSCLTLLEPHGL